MPKIGSIFPNESSRVNEKNLCISLGLGNLIVQMIKQEEFHSLEEARNCIYHSFAVQKVERK